MGIECNVPTGAVAAESPGAVDSVHRGTTSITTVAARIQERIIDPALVIAINSLISLKVRTATIAASEPAVIQMESVCPHDAGGLAEHQMCRDHFADTRQFIVGTFN